MSELVTRDRGGLCCVLGRQGDAAQHFPTPADGAVPPQREERDPSLRPVPFQLLANREARRTYQVIALRLGLPVEDFQLQLLLQETADMHSGP